MYYINCFFIYSIFGFLFESLLSFIRKKGFSSGILFGPWTPIYGIGALTILFISDFVFKSLYFIKWREIVIVFFFVVFILTFLEWLGGVLIEYFFHVVFWNYEEFPHHIGKYISVEVSLFWGIMSLFLIYVIHPFFHKVILNIPNIITYVFILLMFIDYCFTFMSYKYHLFKK